MLVRANMFRLPHLLLLLIFTAGSALAQAVIPVPSADELAARAIAWSESLKSFKGAFTIRRIGYLPDTVYDGVTRTVEYRFDGQNYWYRVVRADLNYVYTEAEYDGKQRSLVERELKSDPQVTGELNTELEGQRLYGHLELWFPEEITKYPSVEGISLSEELKRGENRVVQRNGIYVLAHTAVDDTGYDIDLFFDANHNLFALQPCERFALSPEDISRLFPGETIDPADLAVKGLFIEFAYPFEMNGAQIPAKFVAKGQWLVGYPPVEAAYEALRNGLAYPEFVAQLVRAARDAPLYGAVEWELNTATSELNVPLARSDFDIKLSAPYYIINQKEGEVYYQQSVEEFLWMLIDMVRPWILPAICLVVLAGCVIVLTYRHNRGHAERMS